MMTVDELRWYRKSMDAADERDIARAARLWAAGIGTRDIASDINRSEAWVYDRLHRIKAAARSLPRASVPTSLGPAAQLPLSFGTGAFIPETSNDASRDVSDASPHAPTSSVAPQDHGEVGWTSITTGQFAG